MAAEGRYGSIKLNNSKSKSPLDQRGLFDCLVLILTGEYPHTSSCIVQAGFTKTIGKL